MKKKNIFATMMIGLIVCAMVTTTAISFVYWKSGVTGNTDNGVININIGSGKTYETVVDLGAATGGLEVGKKLVPHDRPSFETDEVGSVQFTFAVNWHKNDLISSSAGSDTAFDETMGKLIVSCIRVWNEDGEDLMVKGFANRDLFEFEFNSVDATYDIQGDSTGGSTKAVTVTVVIKLNEPNGQAQYDLLAGKTVNFEFRFQILSPNDQINVD